MKQESSSGVDSDPAFQEFPRILWNQNIQYSVNEWPLTHIPSQMNPENTLSSCLFKLRLIYIRFHI
jgi:hypothetical protein